MAMAISDMLTVLFPAPWLLYMYTFGNHYKPFYPISLCFLWNSMNEILPNLVSCFYCVFIILNNISLYCMIFGISVSYCFHMADFGVSYNTLF